MDTSIDFDPALAELYESGSPEDEVSVIVRLAPGVEPPPTVRVVSRFEQVLTARIRREDIITARRSPGVVSLKASGPVQMPKPLEGAEFDDALREAIDEEADGESMPTGAHLYRGPEDGRGVVVGICDWGFDFTHANFRNPDGTTRLLCLWDQRGTGDPLAPAPYNYGRLLSQSAINAALSDLDPCASLGYYPSSGDPTNTGAHGTHVADILAGNRREPGSEVGLASGADIVFVHLAAPHLQEADNLGDSVGLLEGLDFIRQQAAGRPCVLHLSAGKTGGPHRGDTLLERAVDAMLKQTGIILVQSVGNYAHTNMHAHARIGPDQRHVLDWLTPRNDRTPNELEIWYSGHDVFDVTLIAPDGRNFSAALGSRSQIRDGNVLWGNLYHRLHEPNSGFNHIVVYLYTAAPSGRWRVVLHGRDVVDGRLHAWIERDAGARYQSRFPRAQASSRYTTNTICNSFRAIAVGAYDATLPDRPPTRFSSRGPTADGRQKPEIAAPGFKIRAARSMPRDGWQGEPRLCVKSGTSMAAPWVSGTVALMMAAAGRPLSVHEIRRALIGTADPHAGPSGRTSTRLGYGYLNVTKAVGAARLLGSTPPNTPAEEPGEDTLDEPILREIDADVPDAIEVFTEDTLEDSRNDDRSLILDEGIDGTIDASFEWEDVQEALQAIGDDLAGD
jgi:subtilisin family serine protease